MMTPQEVANCTFAKSMMGGYNMASVDDFLDKLTEDYAALLLVLSALFALWPLLSALVIAIRYIRRTYRYVKATVPVKVDEAMEKRKEERLEREYEKKAKGE